MQDVKQGVSGRRFLIGAFAGFLVFLVLLALMGLVLLPDDDEYAVDSAAVAAALGAARLANPGEDLTDGVAAGYDDCAVVEIVSSDGSRYSVLVEKAGAQWRAIRIGTDFDPDDAMAGRAGCRQLATRTE
jgi:hypothetical protein